VLRVTAKAIASARLDLIHSEVGQAQQGNRIVAILRVKADADTGRDEQFVAIDFERSPQCGEQLAGDQRRAFIPDEFGQYDNELIAAEAGNRIAFMDARFETCRHGTQQGVAKAVAETVIDLLETVKVDQQNGGDMPVMCAVRDRLSQPVDEQRAIDQPGQRIVGRQRMLM
jgi:hypothetical protein